MDAEAQLEGFIAKYADETAAVARAAIARLRQLVPGAVELVYDNYNALAVAFGATDKQAAVVLSLAVYPRWVSLFFTDGAKLDDSERLLNGAGTRVRHIVLNSARTLDDPGVRALIAQALARAPVRIDPTAPRRTLIKSISAKQRARRTA